MAIEAIDPVTAGGDDGGGAPGGGAGGGGRFISPGDAGRLVHSALDALGMAGTASATALSDAADGAARALTARVVTRAVADPHPVAGQGELAAALAAAPTAPVLSGAAASAVALRLARRFGPLRFLGHSTPAWLVAATVPALTAAVVRGAEELGLVSSHLAHRARAAGIQPDAERVRRAAIGVVTGRAVDPERDPGHARLGLQWLRRAILTILPFGSSFANRDPSRLAAAAAAVDPSALGAPVIDVRSRRRILRRSATPPPSR